MNASAKKAKSRFMTRKIAIDARWLAGGIGTYARNLLEGLSKQQNGFQVHAITRAQHEKELQRYCRQVAIVNAPIYTLREQWNIPRATADCDLLHVPHYNAPLVCRTPLIVTVHDIIHITDPHYRGSYRSQLYARPMLKAACRAASHIVTVSKYSKDQIIEHLNVPAAKVTVIPNGVNKQFRRIEREDARRLITGKPGIEAPYILYVGGFRQYKNLATLISAFALLRARRHIPHKLLLVSQDVAAYASVEREAAGLGVGASVVFRPDIEDEVLPTVYAAAELFVMPSRVEGFGLPVLEAMACGTPVVCSNAASLPEVGGDAVYYFDPSNVEELADAMDRVIDSTAIQRSLSAAGYERARTFQWESSVQSHMQVYDNAFRNN